MENTEKNEVTGLATEILHEFKEQNERLEAQNKRTYKTLMTVIILWFLTVCGFVLYLNQYEYSSDIDQTGLNTYIDSNGNVVTSDLTAEEMQSILEVINNGTSKDNDTQNKGE